MYLYRVACICGVACICDGVTGLCFSWVVILTWCYRHEHDLLWSSQAMPLLAWQSACADALPRRISKKVAISPAPISNNVVKTIIPPIWHMGIVFYNLFMVISGVVYYCFNFITVPYLLRLSQVLLESGHSGCQGWKP